MCIFDVLMDVMCTKFATCVSLGCTKCELYVFNITSTHENFGQCIMVSSVLKKVSAKVAYVYKLLQLSQSMTLLLECSSVMKCKTVVSHEKLRPT